VKKNAARLEKTSHAGIIRIGFEGISQPHNSWSTPVSIIRLKHHRRAIGKLESQSSKTVSDGPLSRACGKHERH